MARVYKFLPQEWALDDIQKQRIKISRICDLNDPFELLPFVLTSIEHQNQFRHVLEGLVHAHGMACFSFKWSNPVLWAHYADKHKGICLGFDVPDEFVRPVEYVDTRLPFPTEVNEQIALVWLFTKFSGWRYEDECRIFSNLEQEEDGNYFSDFKENRLSLREVILGCECQLDSPCVSALLEPYDEEVRVIKARPSDETFHMVESELATIECGTRHRVGDGAGLVHASLDTLRSVNKALTRAWLRPVVVGLILSLGILGGCWELMRWLSNDIESLSQRRAALTREIEEHQRTVERLKQTTWGVVLHEGEEGRRFVVLPSGTLEYPSWRVDGRPAVELSSE